eukprot:gnl/TRDRNA2_/TRDRNA2_125083_c0_seq1.p1 gnl/TRDRNA2_/TRDRNA2_125083_c0~~gnl/TRDRNA2_/TRDRNA2_125083_c0_seq1.p1  ORF type:complete len:607 (+),score=101.79 gnl/TRDRNA2_/TRDRNA2_125083_c0_seq1:33-1853(+)
MYQKVPVSESEDQPIVFKPMSGILLVSIAGAAASLVIFAAMMSRGMGLSGSPGSTRLAPSLRLEVQQEWAGPSVNLSVLLSNVTDDTEVRVLGAAVSDAIREIVNKTLDEGTSNHSDTSVESVQRILNRTVARAARQDFRSDQLTDAQLFSRDNSSGPATVHDQRSVLAADALVGDEALAATMMSGAFESSVLKDSYKPLQRALDKMTTGASLAGGERAVATMQHAMNSSAMRGAEQEAVAVGEAKIQALKRAFISSEVNISNNESKVTGDDTELAMEKMLNSTAVRAAELSILTGGEKSVGNLEALLNSSVRKDFAEGVLTGDREAVATMREGKDQGAKSLFLDVIKLEKDGEAEKKTVEHALDSRKIRAAEQEAERSGLKVTRSMMRALNSSLVAAVEDAEKGDDIDDFQRAFNDSVSLEGVDSLGRNLFKSVGAAIKEAKIAMRNGPPTNFTVHTRCLQAMAVGAAASGVLGGVPFKSLVGVLGFTDGIPTGALAALWQSFMAGIPLRGSLLHELQLVGLKSAADSEDANAQQCVPPCGRRRRCQRSMPTTTTFWIPRVFRVSTTTTTPPPLAMVSLSGPAAHAAFGFCMAFDKVSGSLHLHG